MNPRKRAVSNWPSEFLLNLSEQWEDEVLKPLGFLSYDRNVLSLDHPYWTKRKDAFDYGSRRLQDALTVPPESQEERKEEIFSALQDFLNVYGREALDPFGFRSDALGSDLDHPFYKWRRKFILAAMQHERLSDEVR